jgi:hypothetical protein
MVVHICNSRYTGQHRETLPQNKHLPSKACVHIHESSEEELSGLSPGMMWLEGGLGCMGGVLRVWKGELEGKWCKMAGHGQHSWVDPYSLGGYHGWFLGLCFDQWVLTTVT